MGRRKKSYGIEGKKKGNAGAVTGSKKKTGGKRKKS